MTQFLLESNADNKQFKSDSPRLAFWFVASSVFTVLKFVTVHQGPIDWLLWSHRVEDRTFCSASLREWRGANSVDSTFVSGRFLRWWVYVVWTVPLGESTRRSCLFATAHSFAMNALLHCWWGGRHRDWEIPSTCHRVLTVAWASLVAHIDRIIFLKVGQFCWPINRPR